MSLFCDKVSVIYPLNQQVHVFFEKIIGEFVNRCGWLLKNDCGLLYVHVENCVHGFA